MHLLISSKVNKTQPFIDLITVLHKTEWTGANADKYIMANMLFPRSHAKDTTLGSAHL